MSNLKLGDILKNKKAGDEWYTFMAPEELHFWVFDSGGWGPDAFRRYGVNIVSLTVQASSDAKQDSKRFTKRDPMRLDCGVEIEHGFKKTSTTEMFKATIRVDGVQECNDCLKELSEKTGFKSWEIKQMTVYNSKKGVDLIFQRHNPDSNGESLYFFRLQSLERSALYPDISIHEQMEVFENFKDKLAHCTAVKNEEIVHGCALKRMTKNALRKKSPKDRVYKDVVA